MAGALGLRGSVSRSTGRLRISVRLLALTSCWNLRPSCSACTMGRSAIGPVEPSAAPLIPTARWNSPFASGLACSVRTDIDPAD